MEEYLTVQEVAGLLRMHWQTVLNYIKKGELAALRLDRGYRVSPRAVKQFVEHRTTKANRS